MHDDEKDSEFEEPELSLEIEEGGDGGIAFAPDDPLEVVPDEMSDDLTDDSDACPAQVGFPTRSFGPGEVIFDEGDPGNEAYLILNGQVKLTRKYKDKRILIGQLGADQIFGEMAIITGDSRTATAEAVEPTEVFIITKHKLNENLSQHLAIVKSLVDQLIARIKQLLKQQSTMLGKVEQSLQVDKKIKKIKMLSQKYEQTESADKMDDDLKALLRIIREI